MMTTGASAGPLVIRGSMLTLLTWAASGAASTARSPTAMVYTRRRIVRRARAVITTEQNTLLSTTVQMPTGRRYGIPVRDVSLAVSPRGARGPRDRLRGARGPKGVRLVRWPRPQGHDRLLQDLARRAPGGGGDRPAHRAPRWPRPAGRLPGSA